MLCLLSARGDFAVSEETAKCAVSRAGPWGGIFCEPAVNKMSRYMSRIN